MKHVFDKSKFVLIAVVLVSALFFSCKSTEVVQNSSNVQEYRLSNGIPVYYMENTNNKIDVLGISVGGGVLYLNPEQSGLESVMFNLMTTGSAKYTYNDILSYSYYTGTSLAYSSDKVQSSLYTVSICDYFDDSLDMLLDAFVASSFAESEYDKIMTNARNSIEQELNDPDSYSSYLLWKTVTEGHPYATSVSPTENSIDNLTLENVKMHYQDIMDSRRIAVFAVTRKDAAELVQVLENALGKIPAGTGKLISSNKVPDYKIGGEPVIETRPAAEGTAFIYRAYKYPAVTDKDYMACMVANDMYSTTLFNIIRNQYGACYTPYASASSNLASYGVEGIYRCSDVENIRTYLEEARQMMLEGKFIASTNEDGSYVLVSIDDVIEGSKNALINSTYSSQQTSSGLLSRMMSSYYLYNDISALDYQADAIRKVTSKDVLRVFKKYVVTDDDQWVAVCGEDVKDKLEAGLAD